jgi:myo-inositol 2-dehydrogenase/D-chiro-inositol 1-dehydrogenase
VSNSRIIRAAIIGCGAYGAEHARFLSGEPAATLRAAVDIDAARAEDFRHKFGAVYATTDVARLWADPEIDAVWICTQHDAHVELAIAAAAAGKHVFVEKPLALTLTECDLAVAAFDSAGVVGMTGFKFRFFPAVQAARAFLPRPMLTVAHVIDDCWPEEFWANDPVKGGGNVLSEGCHMVDLVLHLHPAPVVRVYAEGGNRQHPKRDIVDTAALTLAFADGAVANVAIGDVGLPPYASKFALQQSDGQRSFSLHQRLNALVTRADKKVTEHPIHPEAGVAAIDTAFLQAIAEGARSPCPIRAGRRATAVLLAALESLRSHRSIDLTAAPYATPMNP